MPAPRSKVRHDTAVHVLAADNEGRTGVRIDWQRYQAYQDEHALRLAADPSTRENRGIYHASQVIAGHDIWLPSPSSGASAVVGPARVLGCTFPGALTLPERSESSFPAL
jgi:hypothetical protein